jgi:hypothetical protein
MPSEIYVRVWQAVRERKQIVFSYGGAKREACPLILGYDADGEEKVFGFQFGGTTSRGAKLPNWRCFSLASVKMLQVRAGQWQEGTSHKQAQSCVRFVDVDANIPETLRRPGPLPFGSRALQPPREGAVAAGTAARSVRCE